MQTQSKDGGGLGERGKLRSSLARTGCFKIPDQVRNSERVGVWARDESYGGKL